ncbi:MAG: transketolase [Pseudomonadota bacterium]
MASESPSHNELANALRALSMDAVQAANCGHPGMPMGAADIATVLFTRHLRFDPGHPEWPDRDRFVLSAGHGSMLLYAVLHLTGFKDMTIDEIRNFRQLGSRTAGHPEYGHARGIETTTGPLGQGIANAVGMAIAERNLAARFGDDIVDHHTYVIAGDGDLMEGISHEACSLAGHLRLSKLIMLYDDNEITIDGRMDLSCSDDALKRFEAYGWHAVRIDGHDPAVISAALDAAKQDPRPSLIACRTVIGKGSPNRGGTEKAHGSPLGADEIALTREALNWHHKPFQIPDTIHQAWREATKLGKDAHHAWRGRIEALSTDRRDAFKRALESELPATLDREIAEFKRNLLEDKPAWATRKASQEVLKVLTELIPSMLGGSADLTGSNLTQTDQTTILDTENYGGRHIHYGIREHAMVSAMNGMALHRGIIPYGGTFLIFTDYARPAIRLAALMRQQVIVVATHDSIGLGEDGPTHQPIEHLASLRAMPNCMVLRPADAVETAECWLAALEHKTGPSILSLSRQAAPMVRAEHVNDNLSARGGYLLANAEGGPRRATILATGTEVVLAMQARAPIQDEGIATAVVSIPCFELFERQDPAYHAEVLGTAPRVAVEAATPFGWTRYVDSEDNVVGMRSFGASAPAGDLFTHFGITAERIVERIRNQM